MRMHCVGNESNVEGSFLPLVVRMPHRSGRAGEPGSVDDRNRLASLRRELDVRFLAVGDLAVGQPHSGFGLETSNRRTFVHLAPEASRIEDGGIGIDGGSARNHVLVAADHLACAVPNFTFSHELIIGL